MGMFDYLRCTRRMPDGFQLSGKGFDGLYQTKDLSNSMATAELNDQGLLLMPTTMGFDDGDLRTVSLQVEGISIVPLINYTGWLHFYGGLASGKFHSYTAKLDRGVLVGVIVAHGGEN